MNWKLGYILILVLAIIGVSLIFGGKVLTGLDYIGLWCITGIGYILAKL